MPRRTGPSCGIWTHGKLALLSMMGEQKRLQKIMEEAEGEEAFDMCKAIDDLIADGESRGFERGDRQGFERVGNGSSP